MKTALLIVALSTLTPLPTQAEQPASATSQPSAPPAESWDAVSLRFGGAKAATKAWRDVVMKFSIPTEIREVITRGGAKVKAGDPLVRARDADIKAALEQAKLQAENELEVDGAAAALELATFKLDQLRKTQEATLTESKEKEIEAKQAKIQLDAARERLAEHKIQFRQYQGQYERYLLTAQFNGVVDEVMVEVGQGVTDQSPVLRLVDIERLWLDAFPPTSETMITNLKVDSPAWVLVNHPAGARIVKGRVIEVSSVADSVSQQRRVRVEIMNAQQWPAGLHTRVRFTEPGADWAPMLAAGEEANPTALTAGSGK